MRPPRALRLAGWSALGLTVLCVGLLVWFGAWHYPAFNLADLTKADYRQAMDRAARGMAASDNLTFEAFDFLKYREVSRGGEAYVWGAARCRTADGAAERYWVYLEWSAKRGQWLRNYSLVLAAPDDEIYFTRQTPGQLGRAALALRKLLGQLRSHVREVLAGPEAARGAARGDGLAKAEPLS